MPSVCSGHRMSEGVSSLKRLFYHNILIFRMSQKCVICYTNTFLVSCDCNWWCNHTWQKTINLNPMNYYYMNQSIKSNNNEIIVCWSKQIIIIVMKHNHASKVLHSKVKLYSIIYLCWFALIDVLIFKFAWPNLTFPHRCDTW